MSSERLGPKFPTVTSDFGCAAGSTLLGEEKMKPELFKCRKLNQPSRVLVEQTLCSIRFFYHAHHWVRIAFQ